jgi:hypothetical protein
MRLKQFPKISEVLYNILVKSNLKSLLFLFMTENIFVKILKTLFLDWLGEILYFPIWWYGPGLKKICLRTWQKVRRLGVNLALLILLRNIFRPMFGQYDRAGRAISFVMRLLLLFFRLLIFAVLSLVYFLLVLVWIFLPILLLWQLLNNLKLL